MSIGINLTDSSKVNPSMSSKSVWDVLIIDSIYRYLVFCILYYYTTSFWQVMWQMDHITKMTDNTVNIVQYEDKLFKIGNMCK